MRLTCLRCRKTIHPHEPMAAVIVFEPAHGVHADDFVLTPGRWHWHCVPAAIREYVPVVYRGDVDQGEGNGGTG